MYEKYNRYKDSGVEWLGSVPEHWKVEPGLKFIYESKERNTGMKRNTVLSLSYGNIRVREESELTGLVPESFETYQLVDKGDLIFRPTDLQNDKVSLRSSISYFEGIITSAYLNLRFKETADPKFYHYLFRAIDNNKVIYGLGTGLRQNIGYDDFRRFNFPFPPIEEQTAIATFLDQKTTEIDKAIELKQQTIDLLKERKQIVIQELVTGKWRVELIDNGESLIDNGELTIDNYRVVKRGEDELKDSGVEWIGRVPKDWSVRRLKYLLTEYNVRSTTGEEELLSLSKYSGVIPRASLEERAGGAASHIGYKKVKKNHLVINKMQAINGLIAVSSLKGITSPDYSIYYSTNSDELNIHYLCNLILQPQYLGEFKKRVTGVMEGFIRLYTDDLYDVYVSLPPLNEQQAIVHHIEQESSKIDNAISLQEQEIEKLKELKATLIDSAVTGKIRVMDN